MNKTKGKSTQTLEPTILEGKNSIFLGVVIKFVTANIRHVSGTFTTALNIHLHY